MPKKQAPENERANAPDTAVNGGIKDGVKEDNKTGEEKPSAVTQNPAANAEKPAAAAPKKGASAGKEFLQGLAFFSQAGISIAACVFIGVTAGKFLDSRLGTSPWLLLLCSLLGAGAGFKIIFDLGKK